MADEIKRWITPFIIGVGVVWIAGLPIVSNLPDVPLIGRIGLAGGLAMLGLTYALSKGTKFVPLSF